MARMIPPAPPSDTPESERRFFEKLAGEPGTEDWIAFHSLGLSSHYTGHFGEIDFVLLVPGAGVVCVEVKGGGVSQREGQWTSRDRHGATHQLKRSPFAQAKSAMHKLGKAIEERFGASSHEARAPLGYLVVLPDIDCPPPCPEFDRGDVLDRQDIERPFAVRISECTSLAAASRRRPGSTLGPAPLNNLRKFFRPDFDRIVTAGASLKPIEEQIRSLTEEQYDFLDTVDYNDRCILVGPAGSGKTTLALEYARRLAAQGKSVLIACFNRKLGDWLANATNAMGPGKVVAGSLHRLLDDRIRQSPLAGEFNRNRDHPRLFDELYPLYGISAIEELGERFDAVLIDEAQDFRSEPLVAIAETWTRGVEAAKIAILGDYSKQSIYDTPRESLEIARECLGACVAVPLKKNCRNTRRIALQTAHLSGFRDLQLNPGQPEGDAVETTFYSNPEDQSKRLADIFMALKREGVSPEDVVVLGKYRNENSAIAEIPGSPWRLRETNSLVKRDEVAYSTIHAFKGLESAVIVLVDVDSLDDDEGEALLYVGMSRARARLYMLISDRCREGYDRKTMLGLKELMRA